MRYPKIRDYEKLLARRKQERDKKPMTRREIRDLTFKMVFRVEFHEESEIPEQLRLFMDTLESAKEEERAYIEHKVQDIVGHLGEIDEIIDGSAQNWKTSRMAKVELTLIRLAVYEIRYEEDIPTGVAINEAVELAKTYGEENSASFVNGVLARIA
jgi:N utilization substance protein B